MLIPFVGTFIMYICITIIHTRISILDPSVFTVNIIKSYENSSIVLQWDAVDDSLPTMFIVTWEKAGDNDHAVTIREQTSYRITGLALDTVYTITVTAVNSICGRVPEFKTSVSISPNTISMLLNNSSTANAATTTAISTTGTASITAITTTVTTTATTTNATTTTVDTTSITSTNASIITATLSIATTITSSAAYSGNFYLL